MVEADEKNRNVHLLPETGNWKANKRTMEIGFVPRRALKSNGNQAVFLEPTGDETSAPKESLKESRKLMVMLPQLVELVANHKINGFLPVRLQGQLSFQDVFTFSEHDEKFVANEF